MSNILHELDGLISDLEHQGDMVAVRSANRVGDELKRLLGIEEAARDLWDNRLGHRADNPVWHTNRSFWITLGAALGSTPANDCDNCRHLKPTPREAVCLTCEAFSNWSPLSVERNEP